MSLRHHPNILYYGHLLPCVLKLIQKTEYCRAAATTETGPVVVGKNRDPFLASNICKLYGEVLLKPYFVNSL